MTPNEHYRGAERLLRVADQQWYGSRVEISLLSHAQIHAALASADFVDTDRKDT